MILGLSEILALAAAIFGIFMSGCRNMRSAICLYALQTALVASIAFLSTVSDHQGQALSISLAVVLAKAVGVPFFLGWVVQRINVRADSGVFLPVPLSMHACILLLAVSYFLSSRLDGTASTFAAAAGSTAAISLVFTGVLFMMTRRLAISQIVGFLTMENGIYLFGLHETSGMPLVVEMGVLLDVLAAVMIAGVIVFRLKKNFKHIDVTKLTGLREQ